METSLCKSLKTLVFVCFCLSLFFACKKDKHQKDEESSKKEHIKLLYVANEMGGTVSVIDAEDFKEVETIHIMDGKKMLMPHNVQVAPDGKTVWVTAVPQVDGEYEWVYVINTSDNTIKTKINVGTHQHLAHVVLGDDSKFAYVTGTKSNQVIKIDASTFTEVKRFYLGSTYEPHGLRYSDNRLYVACMSAKSVAIVDVISEQLSEVLVGGVAIQTAITPDSKHIFVSKYDTKELALLEADSASCTNIQLPEGAQGPVQMYPTPDNKYLYVCDQGVLDGRPASNRVFLFDIEAGKFIKTITVGNAAHGIVVDNSGTRAYVTNKNDNTVSVIDISSNTVVKTFAVGEGPNGISYWYKENGVTGGMK